MHARGLDYIEHITRDVSKLLSDTSNGRTSLSLAPKIVGDKVNDMCMACRLTHRLCNRAGYPTFNFRIKAAVAFMEEAEGLYLACMKT